MPAICLYFQVHQPCRLKRYTAFDIGRDHDYENGGENLRLLEKVAERCYLPANALLSKLIHKHEGRFRLAFSLSGVLLDQLQLYRPDVLESFRLLAETGCVEFLNETYYHSLSFLFSRDEFRAQVSSHRRKIKELFGQDGKTFRFTELIYSNDLAREAAALGYDVILAEGAAALLGDRSPNRVYRASEGDGGGQIKLLLRNYRLSDDVSFRFSSRDWSEYPLTAEKYAHWIHKERPLNNALFCHSGLDKPAPEGRKPGESSNSLKILDSGFRRNDGREAEMELFKGLKENDAAKVINLFMDYETFGEHQWADTGIFHFLEELPKEILKHRDFLFATPAEIARSFEPVDCIDAPDLSSWADTERDLTAWLGNAMQRDAAGTLYGLETEVKARKNKALLENWRKLQTSDHFYYMCTKWFADGDVHKYFNPYPSPYDAYINYMNILDDLSRQVKKEKRS